MTEQIPTRGTSIESVMRRANFQQGVDDVRLGRPARFDELDDGAWSYERGRQFATIAPTTMLVKIDGRINPEGGAIASRSH